MRRHWAMSSAVSPYGTRNTSSFQTPCQGHLSSKGHRLLLVAVHLSSQGHRLLLVAVHLSSKVHTYLRGTPARVHHLDIRRVRKRPLSGPVRRLGRNLERRKHRRLLRLSLIHISEPTR